MKLLTQESPTDNRTTVEDVRRIVSGHTRVKTPRRQPRKNSAFPFGRDRVYLPVEAVPFRRISPDGYGGVEVGKSTVTSCFSIGYELVAHAVRGRLVAAVAGFHGSAEIQAKVTIA